MNGTRRAGRNAGTPDRPTPLGADYLLLMRGLIGGVTIALALVLAVIGILALVIS